MPTCMTESNGTFTPSLDCNQGCCVMHYDLKSNSNGFIEVSSQTMTSSSTFCTGINGKHCFSTCQDMTLPENTPLYTFNTASVGLCNSTTCTNLAPWNYCSATYGSGEILLIHYIWRQINNCGETLFQFQIADVQVFEDDNSSNYELLRIAHQHGIKKFLQDIIRDQLHRMTIHPTKVRVEVYPCWMFIKARIPAKTVRFYPCINEYGCCWEDIELCPGCGNEGYVKFPQSDIWNPQYANGHLPDNVSEEVLRECNGKSGCLFLCDNLVFVDIHSLGGDGLPKITIKNSGDQNQDSVHISEDVLVLPNPSHGNISFIVKSKIKGEFTLMIYDNLSNIIFVAQDQINQGEIRVNADFAKFSTGVYYYSVKYSNGEKSTGTFMITK